MLPDIRYALRQAAKSPGFTLLVVLTMALGIGTATATFSVVDTVFLRPLQFKNAAQLVYVYMTVPSFRSTPALSKVWNHLGPDLEDFNEFVSRQTSFDSAAVIRNDEAYLDISGKRPIRFGTVSPNFFQMLGIKSLLGRLFSAEDFKPDTTPTAVLSYGAWERHFGSDPLVLGRAITVQDRAARKEYTVIGVLPAGFAFGEYGIEENPSPDVWTSTAATNPADDDYQVIATLKKGVLISDAEGEAARLFDSGLTADTRKLFGHVGAQVSPVQREQAENVRTSVFILAASAGLLLLIACGNVANLLLAEGTTRSHEMALRAAVGAGRGRIVRQLVTESVLLFVTGGTIGTLLANWSVRVLVRLSPVPIPRANEIGVDGRVLLFALAASALTGIVFGLGPALWVTRCDLNDVLKRGANNRGTQLSKSQGLVVVAEISISFVLLVSAGLLTQTLFRLLSESNRMQAEHLLSAQADLSDAQFKGNVDFLAFTNAALDRITSDPRITHAAIATPAPFSGRSIGDLTIEGSSGASRLLDYRAVSKDYFATMTVPLLAGRLFTDADISSRTPVALINETMAREIWPSESAINKRFRWTNSSNSIEWITVVGICGDLLDLEGSPGKSLPVFYLPLQQSQANLTFLIRSRGNPSGLASTVRQQIVDVEKTVNIFRMETLDELLRTSLAGERYRALLVNMFGAAAGALSLIGLYGVISRFVATRTRELSIRMALGAQPQAVLRLVLRRSLALSGFGIGVGLVAALGSTRWLSDLLFGVRALDLPTYLEIAVVLMSVATLATYIPARRAARIDPIIALKAE